jgi:hypothetical protein
MDVMFSRTRDFGVAALADQADSIAADFFNHGIAGDLDRLEDVTLFCTNTHRFRNRMRVGDYRLVYLSASDEVAVHGTGPRWGCGRLEFADTVLRYDDTLLRAIDKRDGRIPENPQFQQREYQALLDPTDQVTFQRDDADSAIDASGYGEFAVLARFFDEAIAADPELLAELLLFTGNTHRFANTFTVDDFQLIHKENPHHGNYVTAVHALSGVKVHMRLAHLKTLVYRYDRLAMAECPVLPRASRHRRY